MDFKSIFNFEVAGDEKVSRAYKNISGTMRGTGKEYNSFQAKQTKVNNKFSSITKDANRASASLVKFGNSFKGLNQIIGVGKLYLLASALSSMVNSSIDAIEQTNLFNVALGNMAEEADTYVQSMHDVFGFDVTNMRNAVGTFNLLARSMGMNSEQAEVLSTNTNKLAYDLASMNNIPINEVMQDLRSGLVGQSETVYKYGIDVTEASLKTEALAQGITKSVRNMSQGEKMALRYAVMIRNTALAQGDFARTINTPANQLKILSERFVTLGRSVGNMFLPLLAKVLPYLNAVITGLIIIFDLLASLLGFKTQPINENIGNQTFSGIEDGADNATNAVNGTTDSLKKLKNFSMGFDELNLIDTTSAGGGGAGGGGAGGASAGAIDWGMEDIGYDNLMANVKQKSDELLAEIQPKLEAIFKLVVATGVAFTTWKLGTKLIKDIDKITKMKKNLDFGSMGVGFASTIAVLLNKFGKWLVILGGITALVGVMTYRFMDLILNSETFTKGLSRLKDIFNIINAYAGTMGKLIYDNLIVPFGNFLESVLPQPILDFFEPIIEFIKNIQLDFTDLLLVLGGFALLFTPAGAFGIALLIFEAITVAIRALGSVGDETWIKFKRGLFEGFRDFYMLLQDKILPVLLVGLKKAFEIVATVVKDLVIPFVTMVIELFKLLWTYVLVPFIDWVSTVFLPLWDGAFIHIKEVFADLKLVFQGIIQFVKGVFTGDWKMAWDGIANIFKGVWNAIVDFLKIPANALIRVFENLINKYIDGLNKILEKLRPIVNTANKALSALSLPTIKIDFKAIDHIKLPTFKDGGFPEYGSIFVAGEAGAEMMGNINGKTAVVNNDQIVESVSTGVARAVKSVLGGQNEKPIVVTLDGEVIYKNQKQIEKDRGYNFGMGAFAR